MLKRILHFLFFIIIPSGILIFLSQDNLFFWDTVQLSAKHALWFYEQNFNTFLLPQQIDSGHIPAFGFYLALVWKVFGQNILISHWAMWPFVLLIFMFVWKLSNVFSVGKHRYLLSFLLLLEPTLLAQMVLVSPDIWIVAFFLWHWWTIETAKYNQRYFSSVFLVLSSLRGGIVLLVLELYFFIKEQNWKNVGFFRQQFFPLLPAVLLFLFYQYYHWVNVDWIAWHSNSPWAESFDWVDAKGFLFNSAVFAWRLLDFGRWMIWLFLILFALYIYKVKSKISIVNTRLFLLLVISILVYYLIVVFHGSLLAHRYFIPIYLVATVLFFDILKSLPRFKNAIYIITVFSILSGHLWVYPDKIAQGWDGSLAHWPYYNLRERALIKMDSLEINRNNVGSDFPNLAKENEILLNGSMQQFKPYDLKSDSLIFYSNIFNNFTDEEIIELKKWTKLLDYRQFGVKVILYKK